MSEVLSEAIKDILYDSEETNYDGEGGSFTGISRNVATTKLIPFVQKYAKEEAIGFAEYFIRQHKLADEHKLNLLSDLFNESLIRSYDLYKNSKLK